MQKKCVEIFSLLPFVLMGGCGGGTALPTEAFQPGNSVEAFGLTDNPRFTDIQDARAAQLPAVEVHAVPGHRAGGIAARGGRMAMISSLLDYYREFEKLDGLPATSMRLFEASPAEKHDLLLADAFPRLSNEAVGQLERLWQDYESGERTANLGTQMARFREISNFEQALIREVFVELRGRMEDAAGFRAFVASHSKGFFFEVAGVSDGGVKTLRLIPAEPLRTSWERARELYLNMLSSGAPSAEVLEQVMAAAPHLVSMRYRMAQSELQAAVYQGQNPWDLPNNRRFQETLAKYSDLFQGGVAVDLPMLQVRPTNTIARIQAELSAEADRSAADIGAARERTADVFSQIGTLVMSGLRNLGRTYRMGDYDYAGSCHGETLAAMSEAPLGAAVLADNGHRQILLTKTEIGQLLSETYAHQTSGILHFAGMRCEQNLEEAGSPAAECRDLNPALFHLAAVELLARRKIPFAVDVDPGKAVFNEVATGYFMAYRGLPLKNGGFSNPGTPVPLAEAADPFALQRAPGTRFLVGVDLSLTLQDATVKPYRYTLELDADLRLIGGEWDDPANHPDFIWRAGPDLKLTDGPVNLSLLQKLAACSRRGTPTVSVRLNDENPSPYAPPPVLDAVPCEI